ncbi:MAG: thiol-disulfide isomerase/thioredoxin [Glaciecola sp.]|jgi:thiol-disulfide isomerase/thioredoxin
MNDMSTVAELLAQAELHQANQKFVEAYDAYVLAAEADPTNVAAHNGVVNTCTTRFLEFGGPEGVRVTDEEAMKAASEELSAKYTELFEADPTNVAVAFARTRTLSDATELKAQLQAVLALEPNHPEALSYLSVLAQKSGDNATHKALLKQAADANPENGRAAMGYAWALDGAELRVAVDDLMERFPTDEYVITRIPMLADRLGDTALQVKALSENAESPWAIGSLIELLGYDNPQAVLDVIAAKGLSGSDYEPAVTFLTALAAGPSADDLLGLKVPSRVNATKLHIRTITALAAEGRTTDALAAAVDAIVEHTSPSLWTAIDAAGLDRAAITADVAARRVAESTTPAPVALPSARTGEEVTLEGRRGKVVLLNFFYPGCGPCRNEFGFLDPMYAEYKDEPNFEILCVNVDTDEAELVVPMMDGNGYGFTALQSDWEWAKEAYGVRGAPSNFLIDHEGRQVAKPHIHNSSTTADFKQLVDELLAAAAN